MSVTPKELAWRKGLTEAQFKAASLLSFPSAYRPTREKIAEECRVSLATLYQWMRNPSFDEVRRGITKSFFIADVPDVVEAVKAKAKGGDVAAARLFLEWAKELDEKSFGNLTVRVTLDKEEVEEKLARLRGNVIDADYEPRTQGGEEGVRDGGEELGGVADTADDLPAVPPLDVEPDADGRVRELQA